VQDVLRDAPLSSTAFPAGVAEASRPFREFQAATPTSGLGRKRKPENEIHKPAIRVNWQHPVLWSQILLAEKKVGYGMSPVEICCEAKRLNPTAFATLTSQVVGWWIDRSGSRPAWRREILKRAEDGNRPPGLVTRSPLLEKYPDIVKQIVDQLRKLRLVGIGLDTPPGRCRGIIVAHLYHKIPQIFKMPTSSGALFKCSESWVKKFLATQLNWTFRRGTRAAQKLPVNVDELCLEQFLRLAITMRDKAINHPSFLVNIDQTNIRFQSISCSTFEEKGSKQVAVVGAEEKRAFTLVVGVSASGHLLPFQAIYQGKTARSLPQKSSPLFDEAAALGIKLEFSSTDTYWSTFDLMCKYVTTVLVPYWTKEKELAGAPADQDCVLQLDVWSVHRSVAFRTWLDKNYIWINYSYVPANCTPVAQPCDVGIQRPLKHVVKQAQHAAIVDETLSLLEDGVAPGDLRLDTTVGTLRDRSVCWMVKAHQAINNPLIVKKACFLFTRPKRLLTLITGI
jgi:hypothetical protein